MDKKERHRLASKRYYERNKQKCFQANLKWKKNNPEKVKISQAKLIVDNVLKKLD